MANIPRVNPTGWALNQKLTSAQMNQTDQRWLRCVVNDGQSDLLTSSSINGGGNKSWAVFGCTDISTTCSAARTETCATYTVSCSGAAAVTAGALALNSGGGLTVTAADGLTASAGGDLTLAATQNIVLSPSGTATVAAAKLALSGTGWPSLGSRTLTDAALPSSIAPVYDAAGAPLWEWKYLTSQGTGFHQMRAQASFERFAFLYRLVPGTVVRGARVRIRGGSARPASMPVLRLMVLSGDGQTFSQLGAVFDPSATNAAFSVPHTISITATPRTVAAGELVFVDVLGGSGAGWQALDIMIQPPTLDIDLTSLRLA